MPAIGAPRLPLVPDPLRRMEVPSDLEPLTTTAAEEEPAAGRMTAAIPEFGSHGKDVITIAHLLSHRAELPNLWAVMRRIGAEAPKSDCSALAFQATR